MCVAMPARVIRRLEEGQALVEQNGLIRRVNMQLVPDVQEGEYVLLNLGVAVQELSEEEAQEILDLWQQIAFTMSEEETPVEVDRE
jgi:hydrogenase expression/formation protein HypC